TRGRIVLRKAPHEMPVEAKFGGKRSGQPLLTAKETERNRFWKGQPLARWKRMQRAVWRTRAPILKSWARRVSIWAERPRLRQLQTEEVNQVVGSPVQEQAEGVGQEA